MNWPQFRFVFTRDVENALFYSIREAIRRSTQRAGGANSEEMARESVESFKRKMDKYAPTKDAP